MKTQTWTEIILAVPENYHELLTGVLAARGFSGFLSDELGLHCFIGTSLAPDRVRKSAEEALLLFNQETGISAQVTDIKKLHQQNWNKKWEQSVTTVKAGTRFLIVPSWRKVPAHTRKHIVLRIDPKMSFGTGHHETTRLCLSALETYVRKGDSVLDFGAGTGVLAIGAVKLGAVKAAAVDNDEWTIENAKENVARNRTAKAIRIILGDAAAIPKQKFDLIVANIDLPTLRGSLEILAGHRKKRAVVILSGLLREDETEARELAARCGLGHVETRAENEWIAVVLK